MAVRIVPTLDMDMILKLFLPTLNIECRRSYSVVIRDIHKVALANSSVSEPCTSNAPCPDESDKRSKVERQTPIGNDPSISESDLGTSTIINL